MSVSKENLIIRKRKTTKAFTSDSDESDNDKKSEKSSGFVDHSDVSQDSSKSLSSKSGSDDDRRKNKAKNDKSDTSSVKSKRSSSSEDEGRARSRKSSSSSDDEHRSRSRSRKSSTSSNESRKSRSRKSSTSSNASRQSRSRKSSTSSNASRKSRSGKSSSSSDNSRSRSRKSGSSSDRSNKTRSRKSSTSSNESKKSRPRKSSTSSNDSRKSRSRKSSTSSNESSKSRSRKSSTSSNRSNKSRSRKSSTSSNESRKSRSRKSSSSSVASDKSRSRKYDSSDDEKRSKSRKSDTSDSENQSRSQSKKPNSSDSDSRSPSRKSDNENRSKSKKSDSSDDENPSVNRKRSKKQVNSDDEEPTASPKATTQESSSAGPKSGNKFSLITESDLESENDDRPMANESDSDDEISSKLNKKAKKLHKKKSSPSKKSSKQKSNILSELADSSGTDNEEPSSPKRVQKSAAKRKSETKPDKESKNSKKEKDPLLQIRSETQRLIREGRISLPYHQPKQRSLHEFLQRRKLAPSIPLKATSEVMKTVCHQLTIKEKEVQDFYKSESDHSDNEEENEPEPNNLPETNTNEVNVPVEPVAINFTDHLIPSASIESKHDNDVNSTQVDKPPDEIDLESKKSEENPSPKEPVEISIAEKDTFEQIIENGSNPQTTPISEENTFEQITANGSDPQTTSTDDQTTPMDIDDTENPPQDSQNLSTVAKSNESANEKDMPDSVDFVLRLDNSCNTDTEELTKPSNEPVSKVIPDSEDFVLSLEDSPCKDTEPETPAEPEKNRTDSVEPISKPVLSKDQHKSRIEALLSTRNIKYPSLKLDSTPESIQFEIPSFYQERPPMGILQLKEKFVKHSMAKNKPKSVPSQVNVVTTQTDTEGEVTGVTKETLCFGVTNEDNEFADPKLKVPGAKHAYLKKKMLDMLISKKEATWNEYQNEKRKYYGSDSEGEKDIDDDDEDDLATCKKLNFEPYHPEDEPDDDELIEDDVVYEEKARDKNDFLDEEAEVSGDDEEIDDTTVQDDDADSVDSDGLDLSIKDDSPPKSVKSGDNTESKKLFKYDTTGSELENKLLGLESTSQSNFSEKISASQIFDLCSGTFATQYPSKQNTGAAAADDDFFVADSQNADDSQDICLTLPDTDNTVEKSTEASNRERLIRPNDTSDNEEEDEEIFTRKKPTMRIVEDSDDDEPTEPTNEVNNDDTSDQENAADDQEEEEEDENNVGDDGDEDEAEEGDEFGYNSEEELVTYEKTTAREFFENEAELSESEWGSDDENEKDLDTLEKEEGDADDFDTDKLKEELGKIHMRQLLDDDQHDVRLLKEMLLEDGELHSDAKRQRKFQWKNSADGDEFFKNHSYDSDEENNLNDDDNDESEEHWRKIRHERETFLSQQEHRKSILNETTTECVENALVQLSTSTKIINESITTKIVQLTSTSSTNVATAKDKPGQNISKINLPKFKCGSFLSRGKLLLSKMALSVSESNGNIKGAKNGRNFVFGARSPQKEQAPVTAEKTEKRKSTTASASVSKKVRLSVESGTPGVARKGLLAQLAMSESI